MLSITEEAAGLLKATLEQRGMPAAVLRIAAGPVEPSQNGSSGLRLELVQQRRDGDEVVAAPDGTEVLIDPQAAPLVDGKTLDTVVEENGSPGLVLVSQRV